MSEKKIEEVRNFDMLIGAVYKNNNVRNADYITGPIQVLYNYYKDYYSDAKQTITKLLYYNDGKDPFEQIPDPIIREKAREIIPNEVKIRTSKNLFELMSRISEIGNIKGSKQTFSSEKINNIILALYYYYTRGTNMKAYIGGISMEVKPEYYSEIEGMISKNEDPFLLLTETYNLREVVRELITGNGKFILHLR